MTCATDGNHGRAVAWGAGRFGCRCVIFVHETVSQGRIDAIASYGAEVEAIKSSARHTLPNGGISNPSLPLPGNFFADMTSATHVGAAKLNKARNPVPAPCRPPA